MIKRFLLRAQRHRLWQPVAYMAVGGWNTIFGVGSYALAYYALHDRVNYFVLMIPCNVIAITNAFFCYKVFVFRTRGNWLREYLRFYVVYGAATLFGMGTVVFLVQVFNLHPVLANVVTSSSTILISFIGHKRISFAPMT